MAKQKVTITPKGKAARGSSDGARQKGRVTITPKGKTASGKGKVTAAAVGSDAKKSAGSKGRVTITPKGKGAAEAASTAIEKAAPSVPARQPSPLVSLLDFPPGLADGVRDVFMAGLGALATLEDEAQHLFSSLIKRGERWEAEARGAKPEQEPDQAAVLAERLGQQLRTAVHDAVRAATQAATEDQASHADLAALREEVAALGAKLDVLSAQGGPATEAPAARSDSAGPTRIEVRTADEGGWHVLVGGAPAQTLPTKAAATEAARLLGAEKAPSEIVLYKQDGAEQRRLTIDAA